MATSQVVLTIQDQLLALGLRSRMLRFVQWTPTALKISQGLQGAIVEYDAGLDLYSVTGYHGMRRFAPVTHVYAEDLARVVRPLLYHGAATNR